MKLPMVVNEPPNIFDPEVVHRSLNENRELWVEAVYIYQTVGVYGKENCEVDHINYYLLVAPGMETQLVDLAIRWTPGRLEWVDLQGEGQPFEVLQVVRTKHVHRILKVVWVV